MPEAAAINASPLIILAQGGRLDLLQVVSQCIVVPGPVAAEVRRPPCADAAALALRSVPWLEIVETGPPPEEVRRFGLGAGEAALLTWTPAHPGTPAILDDRRGRRAAAALGIDVIGTLGLILDAKRRGIIQAARPVIEQLRNDSDWYLSDSVIARALAHVEE